MTKTYSDQGVHGVDFYICAKEPRCAACKATVDIIRARDPKFDPELVLEPLSANGYKIYMPAMRSEIDVAGTSAEAGGGDAPAAPAHGEETEHDKMSVCGDSSKPGWDDYATFLECLKAQYHQKHASIPIKSETTAAGETTKEDLFQCSELGCSWLSRSKAEQNRHKCVYHASEPLEVRVTIMKPLLSDYWGKRSQNL